MKVTGQEPHNSGASEGRMVEINVAAICDCDATGVTPVVERWRTSVQRWYVSGFRGRWKQSGEPKILVTRLCCNGGEGTM